MATKTKPLSIADPKHLIRFMKAQGGMTVKDIAKSERVSEQIVRQSIQKIELYRAKSTTQEMEYALKDFVISLVPQAKRTLEGLLAATEKVEVPDGKTGKTKVRVQEDKTTRLEATRVYTGLITALQPKAPLVNSTINTQVNAPTVITKSETTEERMARIREKAKEFNTRPALVAAVPEYIDAGDDFTEAPDGDDDGEDEGDVDAGDDEVDDEG